MSIKKSRIIRKYRKQYCKHCSKHTRYAIERNVCTQALIGRNSEDNMTFELKEVSINLLRIFECQAKNLYVERYDHV